MAEGSVQSSTARKAGGTCSPEQQFWRSLRHCLLQLQGGINEEKASESCFPLLAWLKYVFSAKRDAWLARPLCGGSHTELSVRYLTCCPGGFHCFEGNMHHRWIFKERDNCLIAHQHVQEGKNGLCTLQLASVHQPHRNTVVSEHTLPFLPAEEGRTVSITQRAESMSRTDLLSSCIICPRAEVLTQITTSCLVQRFLLESLGMAVHQSRLASALWSSSSVLQSHRPGGAAHFGCLCVQPWTCLRRASLPEPWHSSQMCLAQSVPGGAAESKHPGNLASSGKSFPRVKRPPGQPQSGSSGWHGSAFHTCFTQGGSKRSSSQTSQMPRCLNCKLLHFLAKSKLPPT